MYRWRIVVGDEYIPDDSHGGYAPTRHEAAISATTALRERYYQHYLGRPGYCVPYVLWHMVEKEIDRYGEFVLPVHDRFGSFTVHAQVLEEE